VEREQAELSSISSALGELTERVTKLADAISTRRDEDEAHDLYEVERALRTANRRLAKVVARAAPPAPRR
jgi:hypothetical protein